ncbi:DsbA family protein [Streptomyces sp. NPDC091272]|uniref:DsbA family oxidoreductase n=1 Tax=Streptomyces sp. NPDC091272 TaxID=3365981 RepID=UPI00381156B9
MSLTVNVWFDYLCPFSVMTSKVIADAALGPDVALRWRPYELHPGGVPASGKRDYPEGVWENSVVPMAERLGLDFRLAPTRRLPRTQPAMHGHRYAERHGVALPYDNRVFDAYFHEDRDIEDPATLAELAGEVGLDPAEFHAWTVSRAAEAEHLAAQEEARLLHRIHTVPTLVIGAWRSEGVPNALRLREVVEELTARGHRRPRQRARA